MDNLDVVALVLSGAQLCTQDIHNMYKMYKIYNETLKTTVFDPVIHLNYSSAKLVS